VIVAGVDCGETSPAGAFRDLWREIERVAQQCLRSKHKEGIGEGALGARIAQCFTYRSGSALLIYCP
jgi:hypothetical protein